MLKFNSTTQTKLNRQKNTNNAPNVPLGSDLPIW